MTENNLNCEIKKASHELQGESDFLPIPPATVPYRVEWFQGRPVVPMGMPVWEFFGFDSEEAFDSARLESEADELSAFEDAKASSLSILENHEPTSQYQDVRTSRLVTPRYHEKTRKQVDDDIRQRYRVMAYIKGVLRSCLPSRSPVLNCCQRPVGSVVSVFHSEENGIASSRVDKLVHDHNVWVCPVCSLKVAMGRVQQLYELGEKARADGYSCYFLTIQMSHHVWDRLDSMMDDMKRARHYFWQNGTVRRVFDANFIGRVSSLEITRGFGDLSNGWHPHQHIMLIGEKDIDIDAVATVFKKAWLNALNRVGREGNWDFALELKPCEKTEDSFDYLLKYVFEVTLGNVTKHGHGCHMSFFQMVNYAMTIPVLRDEIDPLIREYYWSTKGKRQLVFSDGLLRRFGIDNKSDDELSEEDESNIIRLLAIVQSRDWVRLSHDDLSEIRVIASHDDKDGLLGFFGGLGMRTWDSRLALDEFLESASADAVLDSTVEQKGGNDEKVRKRKRKRKDL